MKENKRWKFKRTIMSFVVVLGKVALVLDIFLVGVIVGFSAAEANK